MDRDAGTEADSDGSSVVALDPVCGMKVERALAAGIHQLGGRTYFFCSASCKQTFRANPVHYSVPAANAAAGATASKDGGSPPAAPDEKRRR